MTIDLDDNDLDLWLNLAMAELDRRKRPDEYRRIAGIIAGLPHDHLHRLISDYSGEQSERRRAIVSEMRKYFQPTAN